MALLNVPVADLDSNLKFAKISAAAFSKYLFNMVVVQIAKVNYTRKMSVWMTTYYGTITTKSFLRISFGF